LEASFSKQTNTKSLKLRLFLISKMFQLQLKLRRSGIPSGAQVDCRNPEAMEGLQILHPCILDTGNPCRYDVVAEVNL